MVHQYQLNGYSIVLDTCSGSIHCVDDVAYDVIAMYESHTAEEITAAMLGSKRGGDSGMYRRCRRAERGGAAFYAGYIRAACGGF